MTALLEINDFATELARQNDVKEDYVADTRRMGFAADEKVTLTLDDVSGEFGVTEHCQHQIGGKLGIPSRYWDRMRDDHPDILTDTVTKLMNREPTVRMVRTLEDVARGFVSNRYRRLDNYELMEQAIMPALAERGGSVEILGGGMTDVRMYLKVLFPDVTFVPADGKVIHGGIIIGNSEVAAGSLFAEPFTYRSFCKNGMVFGRQDYREFGLRKMHVGRLIEDTETARAMFSDETLRKEDEAFYAMAHDLVKGASSGIAFAAIAEASKRASETPVTGDPVAVVERIAKRSKLHEGERGSVMTHLIAGGDLSAWGYANAVTRTAQDAGTLDHAVELERLGAEMLDWSAQAWEALAV